MLLTTEMHLSLNTETIAAPGMVAGRQQHSRQPAQVSIYERWHQCSSKSCSVPSVHRDRFTNHVMCVTLQIRRQTMKNVEPQLLAMDINCLRRHVMKCIMGSLNRFELYSYAIVYVTRSFASLGKQSKSQV